MSEETGPMGHAVARIYKISECGRVWVTRRYPKGGLIKLQGHIGMRMFVNDRIRTNNITFAGLEFFTGGIVGINKDTEIKITKINAIEELNVPFSRRFHIWNRMSISKDPYQIRTSSGGGIKG